MESDGPHNQAGGSETGAGGQVLPFPGDWFGPVEELVPFGPRARERASDGANGAAGPKDGEDPPRVSRAPQSHVIAEDFWGGLAEAGDLVQFPAEPASSTGPPVRGRSRIGLGVAAGLLCLGVIGVRAWTESGTGPSQVGAILAEIAPWVGSVPVAGIVDQQRMHEVPLRLPTTPAQHRQLAHINRPARTPSRRILVSQPRSSPVGGQPVVYSTPAAAPVAPAHATQAGGGSGGNAVASGGGGGAGGGGAGGGGGRSGGGGAHGDGARQAGPTGPGATFGPGKVGG